MRAFLILILSVLTAPAFAQSSSTGNVGGAASSQATQIAGRDASGQLRVPTVTTSGALSTGRAQAAIATTKLTIAAATAATALPASTAATGARILNWTSSPVYVVTGTTGTPASGAPSDFVPAMAGGVPGQWTAPFAPVDGLRVVGAAAGDLTVMSW